MVKIPLARGLVALVDDEDAHLASLGWYAWRGSTNRTYYAVRNTAGGGRSYLHREVLGAGPRVQVDHRDGNGLDCRRSNLRAASAAQNARNSARRSDNRSGFKGVSWSKHTRRWYAKITVAGHQQSLGLFESPKDAALAYDAAARVHFGSFARPNFAEVA